MTETGSNFGRRELQVHVRDATSDIRGKALLKQYLPAAYMWEEAPGIPTRIKDSRIKEIQTHLN